MIKICKIDGCEEKYEAKGYCNKHYKKVKKYGDPLYKKYKEFCTVPGCSEKHLANGYCSKHYTRMRRYGDLHFTKFTKNVEKHGMENTVEYRTWGHMIQRCENKNNKKYHRYGGRGITVCDRWRNSFISFYEDMGAKPFLKAQIDRIDNDKGYYKENCRWVTCAVNNRNFSLAKLTMEKAKEIRNKSKIDNIAHKDLAAIYQVSVGRIYHVINNKAWV